MIKPKLAMVRPLSLPRFLGTGIRSSCAPMSYFSCDWGKVRQGNIGKLQLQY